MLSDMTRTNLFSRLVCIGVIATLFFAVAHPAWAEDEEEDTSSSDYKDPTIVTDDSTSTPDGVKDLVNKYQKKEITDPIYEKWWFWATTIGVTAAWIAFAVLPLKQRSKTCASIDLGCVGDGR
jgi:hypothetical protein